MSHIIEDIFISGVPHFVLLKPTRTEKVLKEMFGFSSTKSKRLLKDGAVKLENSRLNDNSIIDKDSNIRRIYCGKQAGFIITGNKI